MDRTDNIGKNAHFEPIEIREGEHPGHFIVTLTVTGGGFNGTSPMDFELRGSQIASVRIS